MRRDGIALRPLPSESSFSGRTPGGGRREAERSAPWSTNGVLQRGIRKDLWPKLFSKRPVARHFVLPREEHVGCQSLRHCQHTILERGRRQFLRGPGNFYSKFRDCLFGRVPDFHSQRGIWCGWGAESNWDRLSFRRIYRGDSVWAKRSSFRYNPSTQFCHDAPVAQLDRVHGYEP